MFVAFARMAEALMMMPGILTNLAICSDYKQTEEETAQFKSQNLQGATREGVVG